MRTGDYDASVECNRRAAAADVAYLRANPPGHDGAMSYLHDVESLAVAAGFAGRFSDARVAALEIARVETELAGGEAGTRFSAPLAMVLLRFHRWSDVVRLAVPSDNEPAAAFLSHFARAVAFAKLHQTDKAETEAAAFSRALDAMPRDIHYRGNPIVALRAVFEATLAARLAPDAATAAIAWERAVEAEDRLAYHEPPPFYYPVRESLGGALIATGRYTDAQRVFREELLQHPNSGRALFGLWQALRRAGDAPGAERTRRAFVSAWSKSDIELSISDF
jgi:tetratricopeptide (TPR) repeat protein